ncbi:MAG: CoA-binding protein [Candidatus Micrarchaeia archaeon]|jgi:predicted CoA-binding protein
MPSIIIIGASNNHEKYGNKAVRAYKESGWTVYPVNPREKQVEGLKAYADIASAPKANRVTVYVPPETAVKLLPDIARAGYKEVFINPGAESDALFAEAQRLGIKLVLTCSIRAIGVNPSNY